MLPNEIYDFRSDPMINWGLVEMFVLVFERDSWLLFGTFWVHSNSEQPGAKITFFGVGKPLPLSTRIISRLMAIPASI